MDVADAHVPGGDGAGLVEHDGVDPAGGLEDLRALDEDAELRAAAGADEQRGGVARPSAQGQAMIRTATAAVKAAVAEAPVTSQAARVAKDSPMTMGTNTAETRSARRWTSALPFWASSTSRAIWASWVSEPTRVASTTRRPPALTVAPTTLSPGPTSTGTDSPVSIEASMAEVPLTTVPSVATFSPGRTTKRSPTASWPPASGSRSARRAVPEHGDVLGAHVEQGAQRGAGGALGAGPRSTGRR